MQVSCTGIIARDISCKFLAQVQCKTKILQVSYMQDANLANFLHERNRKTKILQVSCVHNKILLISCTGETARQKSCKLLAPVYVQDKKILLITCTGESTRQKSCKFLTMEKKQLRQEPSNFLDIN